MFWIIAAIALFVGALLTFLPLLRGKTFWQPAGLAMIFALPAAALWLYTVVGTPQAIGVRPTPHPVAANANQLGNIDEMIDGLRDRLAEGPEHFDGWMLLARTLKSVQRYPEALEALQVAQRIRPDDPQVMVELAEARTFVSQDGRIDDESVFLLERALELNPQEQKALWLMGIASAQAGDFAFAISYWESLLEQLEPGSGVAQSVQNQINEAQARLGMEPESIPVAAEAVAQAASQPVSEGQPSAQTSTAGEQPPAQPVPGGGWQGTPVSISVSEATQAAIPPNAVMFVVIRSAGMAMGPPLGVRRVIGPQFPLEITLTDADSMIAERKISLESEIRVQARISLSGAPGAASGDWQSAPLTVSLDSGEPVELVIDQRVE
jgi:cytochrome c-type biogenesis protein CcmH